MISLISGKHKKEQFKEASVCLFVFDILFYNGESLLDKFVSIPLSNIENISHNQETE